MSSQQIFESLNVDLIVRDDEGQHVVSIDVDTSSPQRTSATFRIVCR
jgi:hypothetical protein